RLTGQCPAFPKISRFGDAPGRFGLGDPQPFSQRRAQCAAEFFLSCLRVELVDQRVLGCPQPARHAFQALQGVQPFWGGEYVKRQLAQTVRVVIERVEDLDDLLTTARTHAPNSRRGHRQVIALVTSETQVTQGITVTLRYPRLSSNTCQPICACTARAGPSAHTQ